ncbi:MAG: hypothetical protein NTW38_06905 [Candidatus Aminicenantes bacterium]|nr:hypothetical protein [Candidatus Aminicenantes bacterium]
MEEAAERPPNGFRIDPASGKVLEGVPKDMGVDLLPVGVNDRMPVLFKKAQGVNDPSKS